MFRATLLLAAVTTGFVAFGTGEINYRPYVATQLAKAIMQSDQVLPDDNVKEICDGSGWITHGDGHRTPCPGCKACKPDGDKPDGDMGEDSGDDRPVAEPPVQPQGCQCGCGQAECKCDDGDCQQQEEPVVEQSKLMIYHFGASWCGPCQQLKSQTWANTRVKQFMESKGIEIHYFDYDTQAHKRFFNFYKVTSFPTVIFVERDDLNNPERTVVGFFNADAALRFLEEELND
jgi:thiol-disulfide isomerase/thioredoxin